jgi:hypothetical protein
LISQSLIVKNLLIVDKMTFFTKPLCVAWSFRNPLVVANKPKMAFDVTFGLLIISSWSSGDLKQLVPCYSYNLNKVKIMFYFHMFFHGRNTICFVVSSNENFPTPSAPSSNFRATWWLWQIMHHMIWFCKPKLCYLCSDFCSSNVSRRASRVSITSARELAHGRKDRRTRDKTARFGSRFVVQLRG